MKEPSTHQNLKRVRKSVHHILFNLWDPIGVHHEPEAVDEYDVYEGHVVQMLFKNKTTNEIAEYLDKVTKDSMGLSFKSGKSKLIAQLLKGIDLNETSVENWKPESYQVAIIKYHWGQLPVERLPDVACHALEKGFAGSAILQIAGLMRPTGREIEDLVPELIKELGLKSLNKEEGGKVWAEDLILVADPIV